MVVVLRKVSEVDNNKALVSIKLLGQHHVLKELEQPVVGGGEDVAPKNVGKPTSLLGRVCKLPTKVSKRTGQIMVQERLEQWEVWRCRWLQR